MLTHVHGARCLDFASVPPLPVLPVTVVPEPSSKQHIHVDPSTVLTFCTLRPIPPLPALSLSLSLLGPLSNGTCPKRNARVLLAERPKRGPITLKTLDMPARRGRPARAQGRRGACEGGLCQRRACGSSCMSYIRSESARDSLLCGVCRVRGLAGGVK
jgi:hypothetical protein